MKKVFISGCYDIIHAGHIQFFTEARALGDHLTVCFASDKVLLTHKNRRSSIPQEHKRGLLKALEVVDDAVMGENPTIGLDFQDEFRRIRPDFLVVTEDDQYESIKRALCKELNVTYIKLPKTPPLFEPISSSGIVNWIKAPDTAPVRVDFAGGWLDVPKYARQGAFIVNCAVSPTVSLNSWVYVKRSGLGGSGAWSLLNGKSGVESEINLGVGWQDPAVITETGLCIWKSGDRPRLKLKRDGAILKGKMALYYSGMEHDTPGAVDKERDYDMIERAGALAAKAVEENNFNLLADSVGISYQMQLKEGMLPLPEVTTAIACKYCGGGFGGYALYLFETAKNRDNFVASNELVIPIEPYLRL
ncbi:MAG: adenylyltransferase/cytidyltransferase family protein [Verrucomicrobiota bacterium]|nr:adenylyltransferase/cytidyltransferase family protein [Verrucomicrobiota bacterium]